MLNRILNYKAVDDDTIYQKSISRILNGIAFAFFLIAALSAVLPFFVGFQPLFVIQITSALLYLSTFAIVRSGRKRAARIFLTALFEIHIFSISIFFHFHIESIFNFIYSPEYIIYLIYPVLAAVLDLSVLLHALVAVLQIVLFHFFTFLPEAFDLNIIPAEYLGVSNLSLIFYALFMIVILVEMLVYENKCLKQESIRQNDELAELNELKDRVFAIISHDMRSHIGAITGVSELLMDSELDDDKRAVFTEGLNEAAAGSSKLLENLLFWASSQMKNNGFSPESLPLKNIINDCIKEASVRIKAKELRIANNIPEDFQIMADRNLIMIVFRNLLNNAVKFSFHKGRIEFFAEKSEFEDVIIVKDYGTGMEPEKIAELFEFKPGKSTAGTRSEKGFGLGMVICREQVERHGGRIAACSIPGEFTEFTIRLPN